MTEDDLKALVAAELETIAPDVDVASIDANEDLREEMDIDSMDFLNFIIALHQKLKIDIPESDYPELTTLNGAVSYLKQKTGA